MALKQDPHMLAYLTTTFFWNGQRYDALKTSPFEKFKKDWLWLESKNGKTVRIFVEEQTTDEKRGGDLSELVIDKIPDMLSASHIDIYTATPKGKPWDVRIKQASAFMRAALKAQYNRPPIRRRTREDAKRRFKHPRSRNQFIANIQEALSSL